MAGPGKKQQLTAEQRRQRFNEMIQKNVIDMVEKVEIRQNQKEAFDKLMFNYEVQNQLGRMKVQEGEQESRSEKATGVGANPAKNVPGHRQKG